MPPQGPQPTSLMSRAAALTFQRGRSADTSGVPPAYCSVPPSLSWKRPQSFVPLVFLSFTTLGNRRLSRQEIRSADSVAADPSRFRKTFLMWKAETTWTSSRPLGWSITGANTRSAQFWILGSFDCFLAESWFGSEPFWSGRVVTAIDG